MAQGTCKVQGKVIDSATNAIIELVTVQIKAPQSASPEYVQVSVWTEAFFLIK
jgi:hypothetical protein